VNTHNWPWHLTKDRPALFQWGRPRKRKQQMSKRRLKSGDEPHIGFGPRTDWQTLPALSYKVTLDSNQHAAFSLERILITTKTPGVRLKTEYLVLKSKVGWTLNEGLSVVMWIGIEPALYNPASSSSYAKSRQQVPSIRCHPPTSL
jgi:hypothetical protein